MATAVFIETESDAPNQPLNCSGTLVAPNVVISARHCFLVPRLTGLPECTADGELSDPSALLGKEQRAVTPSAVRVGFGDSRSTARRIQASALFLPTDITTCRNDVAVVVLADRLESASLALDLRPPHLGVTVDITGWGLRAETETTLPDRRFSLREVRVDEVGPGRIPPNTFAIRGRTVCFGDSGSGAMVGASLLGVYSRIEGRSCTLEESRNVFMTFAPHRKLIEAAYVAAGEIPRFVGETTDAGPCADGGCSTSCADHSCAAPPESSARGCAMVGAARAEGGATEFWLPEGATVGALLGIARARRRGSRGRRHGDRGRGSKRSRAVVPVDSLPQPSGARVT